MSNTDNGALAPAEFLSSTEPVSLVAVARLRPGFEPEHVHRLVKAAIPAVHAEKGCEQYVVHAELDDPRVFVFYERWSNGSDLLGHLRNPDLREHSDAFFEALDFELRWLLPLSA
ncbi:putative quinol monooxygenase [Lentzea sp. HUAS12]|uniref:putative quinol monooxygenase n=1 Tax=Lentzea sp. HUAS12 TaxID=2951806 RepID=UPI0020A0B636|nr:antibiotic biosynthesis monooxygenase [Lentzea sp. HUAS12]USX52344.1 antibiotic biosynthesis monooxygenase [Lentzea sp. HUAS12]